MKQELAAVLRGLVTKKEQPAAKVAKELGYSKQRFFQLTNGSHDASCEAIEKAINQLGYELEVSAVNKSDWGTELRRSVSN